LCCFYKHILLLCYTLRHNLEPLIASFYMFIAQYWFWSWKLLKNIYFSLRFFNEISEKLILDTHFLVKWLNIFTSPLGILLNYAFGPPYVYDLTIKRGNLSSGSTCACELSLCMCVSVVITWKSFVYISLLLYVPW